jgi:hypothetical protein
MNSSQLKVLVVLVSGAFFAIYLGFAAATETMTAVLWVGGLLGLVFVLGLGQHVWILIPPLVFLQGSVNALPGSPPPWAIAAVIVAAMYLLRLAVRRHDLIFRWGWLDFAIFLQLVAVGQAWMRNPTGLLMFGGDTAGGKPYFIFGAVALAYACLAVTRPSEKWIRWAAYAMVAFGVLDGIVLTLSDYSPTFAQDCLRIYGGNIGSAVSGQALDIEETRGGFGMSILGKNILLPLFCMVPTIRCINPLRIVPFLVTCAGSALIVLSGFRSGVAYFVTLFAVAATARRRKFDILVAGLPGMLAVVLVLASGNLDKLPVGVQRIFTVFGAHVREDVRVSADDSSNDRFEVWETVLTEEGYIRNKGFGDGFSISAREQAAISASAMRGISTGMGLDDFKSRCLATGAYHGFHVETIRFTGVFGLACAIFAMVVFFKCGLRLVRHFRGQPLFGPVLFICLPVMIYLFWSLLVFGSYRVDFPPILIMAGMMKMLDNLRLSQLAEQSATGVVQAA